MATGDRLAPSSDQGAFHNLRIVLVGLTGTGKSATGNTLLGERVFRSAASQQSVTKECSVAERDRFGTKLVVVDTPGICDTTFSQEEFKVQLIECTQHACPGVHAFLFLMKIGQRNIANRDAEAFRVIQELLGEGFLSRAIVVFTAADTLEEDGQNIDEFMSTLPEGCQTFISSCRGGDVAVSNYGDAASKEQAAERITNKVRDLVQRNGGRNKFYMNKLLDEKNKAINERMIKILKQNDEIQNKINEVQVRLKRLIQSINNGTPTQDQIRQRRNLEQEVENLREKLVDRSEVRLTAHRELKYERKMKILAGIAGVTVAGACVIGATAAGPVKVIVSTVGVISRCRLKITYHLSSHRLNH